VHRYLVCHDLRGAEDVMKRAEMAPGVGLGTHMLNALIRAYSRYTSHREGGGGRADSS
jgi:hypothetical protein